MTWPLAAVGTVSLPLLAAAVLAVVPSRRGVWIGGAAAAATLACAAFLPWATAEPGDGLLTDGLAAHLAILAGLIGLITAWAEFRAPRHRPAVPLLLVGLVQLALLSDDIGLAWVGFAGAAMLTAGRRPGPFLLPAAAGVLLALFGTVLLGLSAPGAGWPGLRWTSLAAAAQGCQGGLLSLAFVLLLAGHGMVAVLAPRQIGSEGPVSSALLPLVAFSTILRLRGVLDANDDAVAPGPLLLALGIAALLLGALGVWRRGRLLAASTLGHNGIAAVAFGLGGPAATFAGLLHLTAHSLAHTALRRSVPPMPFAALLAALAGLPPFALFGSEALILTEVIRIVPWLALPFGLGLLAFAGALVARLRGAPGPAAAPNRAAFAWAWLPVAALLGLGAIMPAGVAAWLRAVAAAP